MNQIIKNKALLFCMVFLLCWIGFQQTQLATLSETTIKLEGELREYSLQLTALQNEQERMDREIQFLWNAFLLDKPELSVEKPEEMKKETTQEILPEVPIVALTSPAKTEPAPASQIPAGLPLPDDFRIHVENTAAHYGLEPAMLYAIMEVESGFNQNLVSATKDYGICQINIGNHAWLRRDHGLDVVGSAKDNVTAGAIILKNNLDQSGGNFGRALTGYNTGTVGEPNSYARKVITAMERSQYHVPVSG